MNTNTIDWMLARIPVSREWREDLLQKICPFIKCVQDTGAVKRCFFELSAANGLYIDVYLEADADTVHSVLLPNLKQQFSSLAKPYQVLDPILDRGYGALITSRQNLNATWSEAELYHASISSKLFLLRNQIRKPGVEACFEEISAAINACFSCQEEIAAFAKTNYLVWIDGYLAARYKISQTNERNQQEHELTQFMKSRAPLANSVLLLSERDNWIAANRQAYAIGVNILRTCLERHITRYVLDQFEVGRLWLSIYSNAAISHEKVRASSILQ